MIKITFPDGSVREYAKGTTAYQIAESISPRLAADSLAAAVNGATVDMTRPIEEDASVKFYKWDDEEGKHAFWHTSSHLLAEALEALYPGIKFGIGPAIENGFYYDVDSPTPITEADLPTIENKMVELSRNKEALLRREVPKAEALKTFTEKGDQYKVELITDLEDGTISFYTNGAFTDLCSRHRKLLLFPCLLSLGLQLQDLCFFCRKLLLVAFCSLGLRQFQGSLLLSLQRCLLTGQFLFKLSVPHLLCNGSVAFFINLKWFPTIGAYQFLFHIFKTFPYTSSFRIFSTPSRTFVSV